MIPKQNFFALLCFIILIYQGYCKSLCNSSLECDLCDYCGFESKDYTSCLYKNIFCKNNSKIIYSPILKEDYISFFDIDNDLDDFCGQVEYELDDYEEAITIFTSKNKTFPKNKMIRCHYLIDSANNNKNFPFLEISTINSSESNESEKLNAEVNVIFSLKDSDSEEIEVINSSKLSDKFYKNSLKYYSKLEIFLDFEPTQGSQKDILEIKINFNEKFYNSNNRYYSTYYGDDYSTSVSVNTDSSTGIIVGIILGVTALVCGVILSICLCGGKSESNLRTLKNEIYYPKY